jgi:N-acetylglutamate synthase-like GNAT family acetyltransferase
MPEIITALSMTVRPAKHADRHRIEALLCAEDLDRSAFVLDDFMVAEDAQGNFAGCARLKPYDDCVELSSVAVQPALRGGGIGSLIVAALLQCHTGDSIHLVCEPKEIAFFARFGFSVLASRDIPVALRPKLLAYEAKVGAMVAMRRTI